ncbi:hypothetical protein TNCV_1546911 [Trichonephila clavipes]|nr:hypothetical protein TNCV_1546911 [Trichonephila clavipes]
MGTPTARNVAPAGSEYAETVRINHCNGFSAESDGFNRVSVKSGVKAFACSISPMPPPFDRIEELHD